MVATKETVRVNLVYSGPDVDDGSMSIADMLPVLQGFASGFGKVSNQMAVVSTHKLRIVGVQKGSADIVLEVWEALGRAIPSLHPSVVRTGTGFFIVQTILKLIQLKKHVRSGPYEEKISANTANSINIINSQGVNIEMPVYMHPIWRDGSLDADLDKITSPLQKDRIDQMTVNLASEGADPVSETVTAEERPFFEMTQRSVIETRETWIKGQFASVTKTTKSGYFNLINGNRVFYAFKGQDERSFEDSFFYRGTVKVKCHAEMDENLNPVKLLITEIERLQGELFLPPADKADSDD